jgi:hypothetical protein
MHLQMLKQGEGQDRERVTVQEQEPAQQAMAAARAARDICIQGQQQGDHQHNLMGVYELVEGKQVNGRGVWQMTGGQGCFMYYGSAKKWVISSGRASMELGVSAGMMCVASTALTPDQIYETWQVADGIEWVGARKVVARMCSPEEKRAAVQRQEQAQQQTYDLQEKQSPCFRQCLVCGIEVSGDQAWTDHQLGRKHLRKLEEAQWGGGGQQEQMAAITKVFSLLLPYLYHGPHPCSCADGNILCRERP